MSRGLGNGSFQMGDRLRQCGVPEVPCPSIDANARHVICPSAYNVAFGRGGSTAHTILVLLLCLSLLLNVCLAVYLHRRKRQAAAEARRLQQREAAAEKRSTSVRSSASDAHVLPRRELKPLSEANFEAAATSKGSALPPPPRYESIDRNNAY